MKASISFILLIVSLLLANCRTYLGSEVISWSQNTKLLYADFQKTERGELNYWAYTSTQLKINYSIASEKKLKKFDVYALFIKNKSWFGDTSQYVLNHEQGHFNIAEIHARMLRKTLRLIQQRQSLVSYKLIDSLLKDHRNKLVKFQEEYDTETEHSDDFDEQQRWDLKITSLLSEYSRYK